MNNLKQLKKLFIVKGLFLGCSLLSGVEIIYYLMLIALMVIKKVKISLSKFLTKKIKINSNNNRKENEEEGEKVQHNVKLISIIQQQKQAEFDKDKDIIKAHKMKQQMMMKNYKTRY